MAQSTRAPLLEVREVDQVFRSGFFMTRNRVLTGLSLQVSERTVYGLLGPNGAGKTTLIQLITGFRKPTAGRVRVGGADAHTPEAKSRIGYMPERPYFPEFLTGEKLLRYLGTLSGMAGDRLEKRITRVLEQVDMIHARKKELRRYSKGMLQRIGIAQAILHDPELLILDEPMSGLDPVGRREMRELIQELGAQGKTVFFSTHIIPDVEAVCDEVAILHQGKLRGAGRIADLIQEKNPRMELGFGGITPSEANRLTRDFISLDEISEGFTMVLEGEKNLDRVMRKLLLQNARILWLQPHRPSLEKYFERKGNG